jgi:ELWxxDGT repeat protein
MLRKIFAPPTEMRVLLVSISFCALVCISAALTAGAKPASGQASSISSGIARDPYLVKDIVTVTQSIFTYEMVGVDNTLFMSIDDGDHGVELWHSNGTTTGTTLVKDIDSDDSSWVSHLTKVGGVLYFAADDDSGFELWRSDGTEEGTYRIKDINPGVSDGIDRDFFTNMGVIGDVLYFGADDGSHGRELWKSDGTEEGTLMVKDLCPGEVYGGSCSSHPNQFIEVAGTLFFVAHDYEFGDALWKTNGTPGGTQRVKDVNPYGYTEYRELTALENTLYFTADDGIHGCELWKSDGTEGGTVMVKEINPLTYNICPDELISAGDVLFFTADDGLGMELWKSDGTEDGTVKVFDINPDSYWDGPKFLTSLDGILYFSADDGVSGEELWKSDGTGAGTTLVKDIHPIGSSYPHNLTAFNGWLYFSVDDGVHGNELWMSDGTESGTLMLKEINPRSGGLPFSNSDPGWFTGVDNILFFIANDGQHGFEVWSSDGTEAGTTLVEDINDDSEGIELGSTAVYQGDFFFTTDDGVHGTELWKSDGSNTGTVLVKDIHPGGSSNPSGLVVYNNELYFAAEDGAHGIELWKSDSTEAGTLMVKDIYTESGSSNPAQLAVFDGELYFAADDGIHGAELWKSDGTESGTIMFKDIHPLFGSSPANLITVSGSLYFSADDQSHGTELWKTDGTEAGTVLVTDIYPGYISSGPGSLTELNGMLVFIARDDIHGIELWKSDGTEPGTALIKDIIPNEDRYDNMRPDELTVIQDTLYFRALDASHGSELWRSDGTEEGTTLVKDIYPGTDARGESYHSVPRFLTNVNGRLYFAAVDGPYGQELWTSDGSEAGTGMVKDIYPGSIGGVEAAFIYQYGFENDNGTLFLGASDDVHGAELWRSNGTELGTFMVFDIFPGVNEYPSSVSSNPAWLTDVNGTLYFLADDGEHGRELWAYPVITSRVYLPLVKLP